MEEHDGPNTDEQIPVPVVSIGRLMRYIDLPPDQGAETSKDAKEARAAFEEVSVWLVRMQVECGYEIPEDDETWVRNHPNRVVLGVCPSCLRNDAYIVVGDDYWGMCHAHRHRWPVDPSVTMDMFIPYGESMWDDPDEPVRKYKLVKPVNLAARAKVVQLKIPEKPVPAPAAPPPAPPRLQLVHSSAWNWGADEAWPPPGGATLGERLFRLVGWAYLLLVIFPRELVLSVTERLRAPADGIEQA